MASYYFTSEISSDSEYRGILIPFNNEVILDQCLQNLISAHAFNTSDNILIDMFLIEGSSPYRYMIFSKDQGLRNYSKIFQNELYSLECDSIISNFVYLMNSSNLHTAAEICYYSNFHNISNELNIGVNR